MERATPTATLSVSNSPVIYGAGQSATVIVSASSVPGTATNVETGGATTQTNVGKYAVTADFVPDDNTNHNSVGGLPAGNLVINPASLNITADSTNKLFGQTLVFAGTEFIAAGLFSPDSVTSVTLTSAGAASSANAGQYPIVPSAAVGTGLGNYKSPTITAL